LGPHVHSLAYSLRISHRPAHNLVPLHAHRYTRRPKGIWLTVLLIWFLADLYSQRLLNDERAQTASRQHGVTKTARSLCSHTHTYRYLLEGTGTITTASAPEASENDSHLSSANSLAVCIIGFFWTLRTLSAKILLSCVLFSGNRTNWTWLPPGDDCWTHHTYVPVGCVVDISVFRACKFGWLDVLKKKERRAG
jgi:hypothetical protein